MANSSTRMKSVFVLTLLIFVIAGAAIVCGLFLGRWMLTTAEPTSAPYQLLPEPEITDEPKEILAPYLKLWQAQSSIAQNIPELITLSQRTDGAGYHACVLLARCTDLSVSERIEFYDRAITLHPTTELQLELADLLADTDVNAAFSILSDALPHRRAIDRITSLTYDKIQTGYQLARHNLHEQVLSFLSDDASNEARLLKANAHIALRQSQQALAELSAITTLQDDLMPQLHLLTGRAYEQLSQTSDALKAYQQAGASGAYRRAQILARQGYREAAADAYLESSDPESRWRGALLYEQLGDRHTALVVYQELMEANYRVSDDAAFRAWHLAEQMDDHNLANRAAAYIEPDSHWQYYVSSGPTITPDPPLDFDLSQQLLIATALLDTYDSHLGEELALIEVSIGARFGTLQDRVACAEWYQQNSHYQQSVRLAMSLLNESQSITVYELAYPRVYETFVAQSAEKHDVDPHLIWSIMREESHYNPHAVSSAGAIGLMQIMPQTGQWIADMTGIDFNLDSLTDPETNIDLAAWYIAYLNQVWDGDLRYVLASYNGGQGNVQRWRQSPLYMDELDFFATISFTETREYLTKVETTRAHYNALYE